MRLRHRSVALVSTALALALAVSACGPTPPQAPLPEAQKLDTSTSGISTACGETYQVTAFPGDHRRDLATLEATATSSARKLASVYRRNPAWIYQGETVAAIVKDAVSTLSDCGLQGAKTTLAHLTR
jgi:hypothetical protein